MTKVNENGQVEWTFEELDFVGAYADLLEEIELLNREIVIISKGVDEALVNRSMKDFVKFFDYRHELSLKHSKLYDVAKLILNLKHWKGDK